MSWPPTRRIRFGRKKNRKRAWSLTKVLPPLSPTTLNIMKMEISLSPTRINALLKSMPRSGKRRNTENNLITLSQNLRSRATSS